LQPKTSVNIFGYQLLIARCQTHNIVQWDCIYGRFASYARVLFLFKADYLILSLMQNTCDVF